MNTEPTVRIIWDESLIKFESVEKYDETGDLIYVESKVPSPFSDRAIL